MPDPHHYCMAATTFDADGGIDEAAMRAFFSRQLDAGLGIYIGSGGNGEGHALEPDELRQIYEIGVDVCRGRLPAHANLPEEHTAKATIEQAKIAMAAKVDVIHMYTLEGRHGMVPTDAELIAYFDDVMAAVPHPTCLSVNRTMGYAPQAATVAEICRRHQQIVAVRLSHQSELYLQDIRDGAKRDDLSFYFQLATGVMQPLMIGASIFSQEANILPRTVRQLIDLYQQGRQAEMAQPFFDIMRFRRYVSNWAPAGASFIKMAMMVLKLPGGEGGLRRPYLMPPPAEVDAFRDGLLALRIPEIDEMARAARLSIPD